MRHFHESPNLYIGAVDIKVQNIEKSIAFYEQIIGLKVLQKSDKSASMTADGKNPLIILEQPENVVPKTQRTAGLYHFAILLPTRADLSVFLRHIAEIGYPLGAGDHLVSEALYLNDLDGNGIEVYTDRPSETWKWENGLVDMATLEIDAEGILAESNAPWQGLPVGTVMGHIHLHVSDLAKAADFYTKGLGYEIVSNYPQAHFLSTGGYHHHIAINTWAGTGVPATPVNSVGLNWYEIVFPSEEKREQTVQQLEQVGATVSKQGNDYVTSDPAGNGIRLVLK